MSKSESPIVPRTVGTKLDEDKQRRLANAVKGTGASPAILLRIGLIRVLNEYEQTGVVVLGEERKGAQRKP